MDFKVNVKSLKKMFDSLFPFGIVGFMVGMGLAFLFVVWSDVFSVAFSGVAAIHSVAIYFRLFSSKHQNKVVNHDKKVYPWMARRPCSECGNLTTHKATCSKRKKP